MALTKEQQADLARAVAAPAEHNGCYRAYLRRDTIKAVDAELARLRGEVESLEAALTDIFGALRVMNVGEAISEAVALRSMERSLTKHNRKTYHADRAVLGDQP